MYLWRGSPKDYGVPDTVLKTVRSFYGEVWVRILPPPQKRIKLILEMMTDSMFEKLKKLFEDPENIKEFKNYFKDTQKREKRNVERIGKIIDSLTESEIEKKFEYFLEWERKYEDFYYNERQCLTNSKIFDTITDFVMAKGKHPKVKEEDFLSGVWDYMNYRFKLYQGQGSFWRIDKNGKTIFQTT